MVRAGGDPGCVSARSARPCSSPTCSIQSTALPSSASWMAMWVIAVVGDAPCQCFSPGSNQTTSPGRISSIGPPSRCARPRPKVTISVCPRGCVCHAVRAPGSNVTALPAARAGAFAAKRGSIRTVPVNQSPGPFPEGCEPLLLISIVGLLGFLSLVLRRAQELRPVEIRPVELLLDALERGVANRAVGPERHEPPPRRLCRGAHDRRVRLQAVGIRRGLFGRAELLFRATQLQVVAVPYELRGLGSRARR